MPRLNVGDRVVIDWGVATYPRGANNPGPDVEGEVIRASGGGGHSYTVRWDNGSRNSYREGELMLSRNTPATTPIPKPKPFPASLIKQAKDMFKEYLDHGGNGVAIHVREGMPLSIERGPCHGFIRNTGTPKSLAIVSLLVRSKSGAREQVKKEVVIAWCDWLFNRSPWSMCFKYKSAANAYEEKSCVLRTDVPANLLQGALISTRNTWEYRPQVLLWYKLVTEYGVDEHVAYLAAFFVSVGNTKVMPSGLTHDHVAIASKRITAQGAHALLNNAPLYVQSNFNARGRYEGVHRAFEGSGQGLYTDFVEKFNVYGKVSSVVTNPFKRAKPKTNNSREMDFATYAQFAKEYFGKFKETANG